jgi:hypothetical protein
VALGAFSEPLSKSAIGDPASRSGVGGVPAKRAVRVPHPNKARPSAPKAIHLELTFMADPRYPSGVQFA